jgi:peptidoglycan hydrolase CwlO-like protein
LNHEEDKTNLEKNLEAAEKKWKVLNKQVKEKDKVIHNLKKENGFISEN